MTERDKAKIVNQANICCKNIERFIEKNRDDADTVIFGKGLYCGVCLMAYALEAMPEAEFENKCTDFRVFFEEKQAR